MKRFAIIAALGAVLAGPALADPVHGLWKTMPDDNGNFGHVRIDACGAAICGVLVEAFDGAGKPVASDNIGKQIVWNMKAQGGGKYGKGKVWAPDRDKTYNSKMVLQGKSLDVSGCVFGICRASQWTRVQ